MRWPLRSQLLAPVVLLLAGVAGISFTTAYAAARQAREQIEARLRDVARFLVEESRFPLNLVVLRQIRTLSGADFLLVTRGGQRWTSLDDAGTEPSLAEPIAEDWHSLRLSTPARVGGRPYLAGAVRLRRGANAGDVLYILYPESLWRDARWQAIRPSLVLGGSAGLAALALALVQAQRLSGRVRELERRTRLIAGGDFSPMPLPGRDDEIRDLARSVNDMAGRLAQYQKTVERTERLRLLGQVSGGLAHQLRNGLTGARLALQVHQREAGEAAGGGDALEVALRQLTLLEMHVKRFLNLGNAGDARPEPCDLAGLVGEAVELLRPQCEHAGIELAWRSPGGAFALRGDRGQLGQLLVNLLTNAIEAAGPGGRVEAEVTRQGERLVLEVTDSGPGPGADVAGRLFEPFVTSKPEGVGLGLAVARRVAECHGGGITWGRRDGRTSFRVELPAG
jgi:signal transduction histidine kinase